LVFVFGSWLTSLGALRHGIARNDFQQTGNQTALLARVSGAGSDDLRPVADGIETPFEADAP